MATRSRSVALGPVARSIKLMHFMSDRGHTTIKDASDALGMAPSTVHRLLDLLRKENIVEHDLTKRAYHLGPEFFRLAAKVYERYDVRSLSLPILHDIVVACDETCLLGLYLPVVGKMTFAAQVDSNRPLRYQIPLNSHSSLVWGASGKSILAFLPSDQIDRIHASEGPAPATGEAVPSRELLERELEKIRAEGIAVTRGEKTQGAVGMGAPIFGASGAVIGCLAVTAPASGLTDKKESEIRTLLQMKAPALSQRLGAPQQPG